MNKRNNKPPIGQTDGLMRLFKKLTEKELKMNVGTWTSYLNDYIRKLHPDQPNNMEKVMSERSVTLGNANATFHKKTTMTFKKLLTGLYIIKATRVKITIDVDFQNGESASATEEIIITDDVAYLDVQKKRRGKIEEE